jgi:predicted transcriptional regulator
VTFSPGIGQTLTEIRAHRRHGMAKRRRSQLEMKLSVLILLGEEPLAKTALMYKEGFAYADMQPILEELQLLRLIRFEPTPRRRGRGIFMRGALFHITDLGRELLIHWDRVAEMLEEPQVRKVTVAW